MNSQVPQENNQAGTRSRFRTPSAPAPVPKETFTTKRAPSQSDDFSSLSTPPAVASTRASNTIGTASSSVNNSAPSTSTSVATQSATSSTRAQANSVQPENQQSNDQEVVSSTGSMAIATLISRITGFLRNVLLTSTLGGAVASAFNVANTLPNLITEVVLGAVLTSLVVPVLVRAEKEDADRGAAFIRRLFTLSATLLAAVTLISIIGAPLLVRTTLDIEGKVNVIQSTSFAYLLLPQIFFYGVFALLMAVLNTKGVFKPGAWAPVINNLIVLVVMGAYWIVPGSLSPSEPAGITDPHVLLLGIGTTLGVVIQALIMIPPIRKAGVSLRPLWGLDDRLKQFGGMALAIVVYVLISQLGYIVTTRIASLASDDAPIIYQQHWMLLQVPYGIIGVTLLTAIMPRLSRNAANGDDRAVVRDLVVGSKLTFIALIPIVVFFSTFGTSIAHGLFAYGNFGGNSATTLGLTLSFSAFTLIPYALVLLHLRVFYAREEAWTPTYIIAGITVTKIVLSFLAPYITTNSHQVVILLGAANGFGFIAGAVIGALLLRRKLGNLGSKDVLHTSLWALGSSLIGVSVALVVKGGLNFVLPQHSSFIQLVILSVVGVIFLIVTGLVLSRSGLSEVATLGTVLHRIPGLRRFITVSDQSAPMAPINEVEAEALRFDATFNASPVPPPMSAGIVRGPRLVPGAEVSDGRFRLLADHGSVPGARFWQAREKLTGREVALTFVDTSGQAPVAPLTPAAAAAKAAEVSRRTRLLAGLGLDCIAPGVEIINYRSGCIVIADWTPGRPLAAVATEEVNPYAALVALTPLAQAATIARSAHTSIGLDNRARIRINTSGMAVLAFPAVLEGTSFDKDIRSIRTALATLVGEKKTVVEPVVKSEGEEFIQQLLAVQIPDNDDTIDVAADIAPQPESTPGFGRKGYSRAGIAILGLAAIAVVVSVALLTAYLISLFNNNSSQSPINNSTLSQNSSTSVSAPNIVVPLDDVSSWEPNNNILPNSADLLFDDDPNTAIVLPVGTKTGIWVTPSEGIHTESIVIGISLGELNIQVYGVSESDPQTVDSLTEAELISNVTASERITRIDVGDSTAKNYIVWLENISQQEITIDNLTVVGHHTR
ncbi:murein biosynthesis integral membrane protein MurJ [Corynebacterium kutscheri]|uniref:Integral membrane protein n=1 Tax=Corynebacterium kutscheri TaxID=35755 RepID=A0AB38VQG2_9CORY|nr:murein biosynthesis integral membrane protein MurJ [Corynebacterium kutscheri]VEH05616.1 putative integral membrane protein [Corynebacterium kutscheri]